MDLTDAVEAGSRALYEAEVRLADAVTGLSGPTWDEVKHEDPLLVHVFREQVAVVVAAVTPRIEAAALRDAARSIPLFAPELLDRAERIERDLP